MGFKGLDIPGAESSSAAAAEEKGLQHLAWTREEGGLHYNVYWCVLNISELGCWM
jgi:hypothetical protein